MFGTLHYNRDNQHSEFIDRTNSFLGDAASEHAACDKCRLTKLKCTGQRSGCDRCKVRGTPCVYSAIGSGRHKRMGSIKSWGKGDNKQQVSEKKQKRRRKRTKEPLTPESDESDRKESVSSSGSDADGNYHTTPKAQAIPSSPALQQTKEEWDLMRLAEIDGDVPMIPQSSVDLGWIHSSPDLDKFTFDLDTDLQLPSSPFDPLGISIDTKFLTNPFLDSPHPDIEPLNLDLDDGFTSLLTCPSPLPSPPADPTPDTSTCQPDTIFNPTLNPTSCTCLPTIVTSLEDLDSSSQPTTPLDASLALLKTQISSAERILTCTLCRTARAEHMALLTRICEELVKLGERIVSTYLQQRQQLHQQQNNAGQSTTCAFMPPTPAASPTTTTPSTPTPTCAITSAPTNTTAASTGTGTFFGKYQTDPGEWECLMRVLVEMQLKALGGLLTSLLRRGCSSNLVGRIQAAEGVVGFLVGRLEGTYLGS